MVDIELIPVSGGTTVFANILSVITLVCAWKVYEDRGEAGWKALIPFYSELVFGRVVGNEELGRKKMLSALGVCLLLPVIVISAAVSTRASLVTAFLGSVAFTACSIAVIVYDIKMKSLFVSQKGDQSWLVLLWFLMPVAGWAYYAFVKEYLENR